MRWDTTERVDGSDLLVEPTEHVGWSFASVLDRRDDGAMVRRVAGRAMWAVGSQDAVPMWNGVPAGMTLAFSSAGLGRMRESG